MDVWARGRGKLTQGPIAEQSAALTSLFLPLCVSLYRLRRQRVTDAAAAVRVFVYVWGRLYVTGMEVWLNATLCVNLYMSVCAFV